MKIVLAIVGIVLVLLGGLWALQGLGIMQMAPILCVGECTPLEGPDATWATKDAASPTFWDRVMSERQLNSLSGAIATNTSPAW